MIGIPSMLDRIRRIIDVARWEQPAGTQPLGPRMPIRWHRLELVTAGRAWCEDGGGERQVEPGDVVWDGPGERCLHRTAEAGFTAFTVTVEVRPGTGRDGPRIGRWADRAAWRAAIADWSALWREGRVPRRELGIAVFARLRLAALRGADAAGPSPAVMRAVELIDRAFAEDLGIDRLCAAAGCGRSRLHALFSAELGATPHRRLLERRVEAARARLSTTREPLAAVAGACGFADAASLCRVFRRELGISPGDYRAAAYR